MSPLSLSQIAASKIISMPYISDKDPSWDTVFLNVKSRDKSALAVTRSAALSATLCDRVLSSKRADLICALVSRKDCPLDLSKKVLLNSKSGPFRMKNPLFLKE